MVEVFTIGGGEYIVNTFNAVAAWTGGGGYRSLLRVVMVLGLIYSLLCVAFTMNVRVWMNWFIGSTLIYMCLMVPTVSVKVTDRINPSLAPATVANVPLGLGVIASFTSQVGDWLTRTAETVFTMPSQLNYSTNGMVYGARLFDATRNFEIRDAEFATNLSAHFKNCVFGDIMLGQKSMTDLANAKDLWTAMGPGSVARSQPWVSRSGASVTSDIITCNNAYNLLSDQWTPMIAAHTPIWSKQAFPKLSTAVASAKLRADVPIVNQAFTASSANYEAVMRQNTAINAFMQARDGMAGGPGAASIDTFATTRADIQARNTYNSIAQQAMSWVPILNIVLTVVFYAMFPVIFPLFLMPQTGVGALKGYLTGFFYLASWGPLYVILHMICMTRTTSAAQGAAEGGMSLGTFAGIGAVNAETATIAGFMLMSVPFLAAGLAKGAMSISGQATSVLNPAQNAAEAAAAEQTTGNYSYGNTSFANSTSNMRQANQWSDAMSYTSGAGAYSYRHDNGATSTSHGNGFVVTDTTGAMSRLSVTPTLSTGYVSEMRQAASMLEREAQSEEAAAARILSTTHTDRSARGTSTDVTKATENGAGIQTNIGNDRFVRTSGSTFDTLENRGAINNSSRVTNTNGRGAEVIDSVSGGLSVALGGGGPARPGRPNPADAVGPNGPQQLPEKPSLGQKLAGALPQIKGSKTWTGQQTDSLRQNQDQTRSVEDGSSIGDGTRNEQAYGENLNQSTGNYTRSGTSVRAATSQTSSVSTEDARSLAYSHELRARQLHEKAQQLSNDASYAETHGMQMSENMSQELAQWYAKEQAEKPALNAPGLHETAVSDQQRVTRDQMVSRFLEQKRQDIYNGVAPRLHEPDLVDVPKVPVSTAADVEARYHPTGLRAVPTVGGSGDGSATVAQIDAQTAAIKADQDAKKVIRAGAVEAGSAVRGEVDEAMRKGFFTDPELRK
ncbi:conjugal transfer mating pair stabilization protein TraG [Sphingomonas sp. BE138]|uniref:conjugal transfer protein TraG N-terminal domain-containing protein n=1 Tax=Sphingomonas sp. BE138 TaxID=2817845 RepID=UPI0028624AA3|nr:conjugal transfer protein TraG N-terminal domain-containing protein [Sphingomonas sp. BE138]MDR6789227.1 conjugal transfer mating pair stabilization protein TraG [Sphingomonas sp. BE138]